MPSRTPCHLHGTTDAHSPAQDCRSIIAATQREMFRSRQAIVTCARAPATTSRSHSVSGWRAARSGASPCRRAKRCSPQISRAPRNRERDAPCRRATASSLGCARRCRAHPYAPFLHIVRRPSPSGRCSRSTRIYVRCVHSVNQRVPSISSISRDCREEAAMAKRAAAMPAYVCLRRATSSPGPPAMTYGTDAVPFRPSCLTPRSMRSSFRNPALLRHAFLRCRRAR